MFNTDMFVKANSANYRVKRLELSRSHWGTQALFIILFMGRTSFYIFILYYFFFVVVTE